VSSNAIPSEILEALNKPFGFALLIKGMAGTGKTTFALEILKRAKNPIYISTRVSPEFLYEQFPWVKEFLPPSNIYDATQTFFPAMPGAQAKRFQVFKYNNVPNFIEIIFEHFQGEEEPTIVIDSWDAVIGYKYPETVQEERFSNLITELVRKTNIKLILVAENPETSFLDYIVDGLVINRDIRIKNRRVRVVEIVKLRSIRINQPYYTYTLESGRFKAFPRYQFQFSSILIRPEPIPDPHKEFVSTGIPDLDNFFGGGYKKGSFNLMEVAHGVGDGFLNFIIPLFVNFLILGRGIVSILPEGYSTSRFSSILENFIDKNQYLQQLISFDRLSEDYKPEKTPFIQPLNSKAGSTFKNIWNKAALLKEKGYNQLLYYFSIDKLENMYEENEILKELSDHIAYFRGTEDITVASIREGQPSIEKISHMTDIHWKMRLLNKALAIYSIQPESEFQMVTNDTSKGYVTLKLTPLV